MERSMNVLVVEDDPVDAEAVTRLLRGLSDGNYTETAGDMRQAKLKLRQGHFDAVVMDLGLPDSQGVDSIIEFQASAPELPLVVLTGNEDERLALKSVDLGAEDYLSKSELNRETLERSLGLARERHKHKFEIYRALVGMRDSLDRARDDANTDALTGLPNRRGLLEHLTQMRRSHPTRSVLVALADVDQFKSVNDTHGHDVGDVALREFARRLLQCMRSGDYVARVGGDEFVLVFETLERREARSMGLRILKHVAADPVATKHVEIEMTATIAMLELQGIELDVDNILSGCHPLLSRGKANGRNQLELSWDEGLQEGEGDFASLDVEAPAQAVRMIRALATGACIGHRVSHGLGGGDLLLARAAVKRAKLRGDLPEWSLDCFRQAAAWRRRACPTQGLHLDLESEALSPEAALELTRIFADPAERAMTVIHFHSSLGQGSDPAILERVHLLKKAGFGIGIRAVGDGSTVMENLALLRPSWIRLDPVLTYNVAGMMRKADWLRSMIGMLAPLRSRMIAEECASADDEAVLLRAGFYACEWPESDVAQAPGWGDGRPSMSSKSAE